MELEQSELRDVARQMLSGLADADPSALWSAAQDAGWTALTGPEAQGGLEQPFAAAAWLYLELGRALSPLPLAASLAAVDALAAAPASAARDALLEQIIGGEAVGASLLQPADVPLEVSGDAVSGVLSAVADADAASHILVASGPAQLVALVPASAAGLGATPRRTWDETRRLHDVTLTDLSLADAPFVLKGADAQPALDAIAAHLHFAVAADCVGAAEAALEQSVEYLKTRRQFDRPLAMFQALKHRCADLLTRISLAEAFVADQVDRAARGEGDRLTLARGAKAMASGVFRQVAEEAVQLHGGIAMTTEYPCHRFLKRALLNEHLASGNATCELAVADAFMASNG